MTAQDKIQVGKYEFGSRLFVGTGKYASYAQMRDAIVASGTELVTVALRRVNLDNPDEAALFDYIPKSVQVLPNTAGCATADQAVAVARLARASGIGDLIKLEIIGDQALLWPDTRETLIATERLNAEGFTVMVYTTPDPVVAIQLQQAGAAAIMPLGSPIGSGQGVLDVEAVGRIKARVTCPVVVDAGIGGPADAALAMEAGADAVLVNTAIARAQQPVQMAEAIRLGVIAGRLGYMAGRIPRQALATASSPSAGMVTTDAS